MQMSNSEGRPRFVITVRYTIEGETYTKEHIPAMSTELSSSTVQLVYLPGYPKSVRLLGRCTTT